MLMIIIFKIYFVRQKVTSNMFDKPPLQIYNLTIKAI